MSDVSVARESVWNYPRPPRLEPTSRRIRVVHAGIVIADTTHALRILETSHPPVHYIHRSDLRMEFLNPFQGKHTFCEFKGEASYWNIDVSQADDGYDKRRSKAEAAAWSYENPSQQYAQLADHLAFYASRVNECWVDEERVKPQLGDFYGGWITTDLIGPFKGPAGTLGW